MGYLLVLVRLIFVPDTLCSIIIYIIIQGLLDNFEFYNRSNNYSILGGSLGRICRICRDASRGLATFNVDAITDKYVDLLDLKAREIEQVGDAECYSDCSGLTLHKILYITLTA